MFTIEKVPGAPVVILAHESRQAVAGLSPVIHGLTAVLDAQPEPVFLVLDIHGLANGMAALAHAADHQPDALLRHPNVRESLIVSATLARAGGLELLTAAIGEVNARVFDTTEQALAYCRERIAVAGSHPAGGSRGPLT